MIMKKTSVLFMGVSTIVLALASAVSTFGQEKPVIVEKETTFQGPVPMGQGLGQLPGGGVNNFTFVSSEFSFDRLVKGAPYSAQAVTETTQMLGDGNRIINTNSATVYRDSEGRTRREQTLRSIGPFSPSSEPMKTILISDPSAGVGYMLDPANRVAHKNQAFHMDVGAGGLHPRKSGGTIGEGEGAGEGPSVGVAFTLSTGPNGEMQKGGKAGGGEMKIRSRSMKEGGEPDVKMEGLGTQTVEGVNAVGSRTTITIPAGQIGNERPIEIVDERWFSEELQTVIMTRHTDPRMGETVYRLTNIIRAEPDRSLFEVPSDYTIKEEQPMRFRINMKKPNPEEQ
jgi:hypothetical protein